MIPRPVNRIPMTLSFHLNAWPLSSLASLCRALGCDAPGALTSKGMNALMACANNLDMPIEDWTVGGVPITMMCHMERRKVNERMFHESLRAAAAAVVVVMFFFSTTCVKSV